MSVPVGQYGQPELPKGAQRLYSKPGKGDQTGWYVDPRSGEVDSVAFRVPEPKAKGKGKGQKAAADVPPPRPPLTQRGTAMLGDLRTEALHEAVRSAPAEAETLLGLLILAFSADNVSVTSPATGNSWSRGGRGDIAAAIVDDGTLTVDELRIVKAARSSDMTCGSAFFGDQYVSRVAHPSVRHARTRRRPVTRYRLQDRASAARATVAVRCFRRAVPWNW